jgi:L,D-transpeptidase catalytic domain
MQMLKRVVFVLALCGPFIFSGCETSPITSGGPYHVTAYKPNDPSKVVVKVSLSKQNVYVMEGDHCLMAVACSVGVPSKPTPRGNFTIYRKEEDKRSGSYGFRVQGDRVVPAEAGSNIPGRYVGYPMGFWCEFAPAYGFHPAPRTHGCIRLKGEAAPKFYALVHNGTPVHIATTQPEDETIGPKVKRVDDSRAPDPDPHISITSAAFQKPSGPLLE